MARIRTAGTDIKALMKEALSEVLEEKQELIQDAVRDAIEDISLAKAIEEGKRTKAVSRATIFRTLAAK
ncbi:MAG: hypothetical protein IAF08_06925 [Rhizobacter sp.]|nr:hypothetical protein [Chlorobiales bacterium]